MQIVTNKHYKNLLKDANFLNLSKFRVYLLPKRDLKISYQYKISFRMMFCRPSTAILLLAWLKIFLFSLHTPTLKIAPFLPNFEFLPPPPRRNLKSTPNFSKILHTSFFMHVPLFVTSRLDFEKKIKNRYTLMQKYEHSVKAARFILTPMNDDFNFHNVLFQILMIVRITLVLKEHASTKLTLSHACVKKDLQDTIVMVKNSEKILQFNAKRPFSLLN